MTMKPEPSLMQKDEEAQAHYLGQPGLDIMSSKHGLPRLLSGRNLDQTICLVRNDVMSRNMDTDLDLNLH